MDLDEEFYVNNNNNITLTTLGTIVGKLKKHPYSYLQNMSTKQSFFLYKDVFWPQALNGNDTYTLCYYHFLFN